MDLQILPVHAENGFTHVVLVTGDARLWRLINSFLEGLSHFALYWTPLPLLSLQPPVVQ